MSEDSQGRPSAAIAALDTARVDELASDLVRTVETGRRQLHEEKEKLILEFEASRVQLHTEYSQRLLQADEDLQNVLEERSSRRQAASVNLQEIVSLNVGGKVFTVKRETLCVCRGSFLAELFSGRWDGQLQKDDMGQFFLDIDPDVFDIILGWLRDCKIESPTRPASSPTVPAEHMQHFQAAVDYLGLRPFLAVGGLGPNGWGASAVSTTPEAPAEGSGPGAPSFLKAAGTLSSFLSWRSSSSFKPPPRAAEAPMTSDATSAASAASTAGAAPSKVVGWSQRSSDPAVGRRDDEVTLAFIPETRGSATARATRGFQSGSHCFGVQVIAGSDGFVGLVSPQWTAASAAAMPLGRAAHSWAVASDGSVWAGGRELERLPVTFAEGSCIAFALALPPAPGLRTATAYIDGRPFEHVFTDLPDTVQQGWNYVGPDPPY
ncbi:SHKBP1 [Symbiodinium natans]|uniref:SHKBP1 protein n=1 Tax=Symbiodinium natans TaxID=878477 RepID=A0A812P958_9DINO|nr:SHKBP1 [Symbiodinium natans]